MKLLSSTRRKDAEPDGDEGGEAFLKGKRKWQGQKHVAVGVVGHAGTSGTASPGVTRELQGKGGDVAVGVEPEETSGTANLVGMRGPHGKAGAGVVEHVEIRYGGRLPGSIPVVVDGDTAGSERSAVVLDGVTTWAEMLVATSLMPAVDVVGTAETRFCRTWPTIRSEISFPTRWAMRSSS